MADRTVNSKAPVSSEIHAVLLLSQPNLRAEDVVRLRDLLHLDLDWSTVFGMLALHRTMGMAWGNILYHFIEERGSLKIGYFLKSLEVMFKGQRRMAEEQVGYAAELQARLASRGVVSAYLKGAALATTYYTSPGMRVFNDNDILVDRADLAPTEAVLRDLGYMQGSWDYSKAAVRPAKRADILLFPMNSHQTHPYMRPTPDAAMLECHRLDVHFSIDLLTGNRTDGLVSDMLGRSIQTENPVLRILQPEDLFIFGCIHYYKEATHVHEIERYKDLVLYKLVDLLVMLSSPDYPVDHARLTARIRDLDQQRAVYFALAALAELFPGRVEPDLLRELRPGNVDYLDQVGDNQGSVYRWKAPLLERFFNPLRIKDLVN